MSEVKYPDTLEEIKNASHEQICVWYRFLTEASNTRQEIIMRLIIARYNELGGMTAEISKKIGW